MHANTAAVVNAKPMPCIGPTTVRANLLHHAEQRKMSLAALSKLAGKNAAYLQQFIERGSPKVLPEDTRLKLAMTLNIDERLLGAREPWKPAPIGDAA